jgi:mannose-6-phosphate isomerase class I
MPYEPNPHYEPIGGSVQTNWREAVASLRAGPAVLALDGPAVLDWEGAVVGISRALAERGRSVDRVDLRTWVAPWEDIVKRTGSIELPSDPDFETLASGPLATIFDRLPQPRASSEGWVIVYGPGAALTRHDVLWYLDLPKRYAEAAVVAGTGPNLGQAEAGRAATTRRLFYVDWPLLDRHRDAVTPQIDRYVDTQDVMRPCSIDGPTLRRTAAYLAGRPFRTRPTFNSTPWGGHWAQRELRVNLEARNTALGYELIAPEAGVLVGHGPGRQVEVPFQLVVSQHPLEVLGERVHRRFGTSFPIRFDYLDTLAGGNLSVHCHPRRDYMKRVFGWPYTQHETYYVMVGGMKSKVFLGLRGDADVATFHRQAIEAERAARPFAIEKYVQTHRAEPHQLFAIPAGTAHGSGEGNVVLEVSATPYLYSLRLYDWLRKDADGTQRPVHIKHAFANLNTTRTGIAVEHDLIQRPRVLRDGREWREELLGRLPEMFFEVRRIVLESDRPAPDDTARGFHVINVVDGSGVVVKTESGDHALGYAETLVIPAAVGCYSISRLGSARVRVVKALVR